MLGNTMDTKNLRNTEYMKRWFDQVGFEAADEIERLERIISKVTVKCDEEIKIALGDIEAMNIPGNPHNYQDADIEYPPYLLKAYKEISALMEVMGWIHRENT